MLQYWDISEHVGIVNAVYISLLSGTFSPRFLQGMYIASELLIKYLMPFA